MKKTPEPHLHNNSSQRNQNTDKATKGHNHGAHNSLKYFKSVVKKFSGVFSFFRSSGRKSAAKNVGSEERRNTSKTRLVSSCKLIFSFFCSCSRSTLYAYLNSENECGIIGGFSMYFPLCIVMDFRKLIQICVVICSFNGCII